MSIYLDHAATTNVQADVLRLYVEHLEKTFANPSSNHRLGQAARKMLADQLVDMGIVLGCSKSEIILTSGGSEATNLAIKGYLNANLRVPKRIITSQGEHSATRETLLELSRSGYDIVWLPLDSEGTVCRNQLEEALSEPAALISLIHVSNETGAVNDLAEIRLLRDRLQPTCAIHIDAVQSLGKHPFQFASSGVDLMSGSGHKLGAPKGIGWLAVRSGTKLSPQILGGGQQGGLRSGTENPPLAAALAKACQLSVSNLNQYRQAAQAIRKSFLDYLDKHGVSYQVLSPRSGVPHILSIAFPGLRGETLMHALEDREIYLSTGSACASHKREQNHVLQAMGLDKRTIDAAVRISFSVSNTENDVLTAANEISRICKWLIRK